MDVRTDTREHQEYEIRDHDSETIPWKWLIGLAVVLWIGALVVR